MKKKFVYEVVDKQNNNIMDTTKTRSEARGQKRSFERIFNGKYKIVQYAVSKVVR